MIESIKPCLWFDGNGEEAMLFYVSIFKNGEVTNSGRPEGQDASSGDTPMVVNFKLAGQEFMALNGGPYYTQNPAVSYFVQCETAAEVDDLWAKLSEGGTALMELGAYPFSKRYGWIQDRFGVSWQLIECGIPQSICPCLLFTQAQYGRAEEAITFYRSVFEQSAVGQIDRYGEGEAGNAGTVKYAEFSLLNQPLVAMDGPGDHDFTFTPAASLFVTCETQAEIDYLWNTFTAGGAESQCGWLVDKFGLSWQIVPAMLGEIMSGPDHERGGRVMQALMKMIKLDIAALQAAADQA